LKIEPEVNKLEELESNSAELENCMNNLISTRDSRPDVLLSSFSHSDPSLSFPSKVQFALMNEKVRIIYINFLIFILIGHSR
jgi:hypothetical protein